MSEHTVKSFDEELAAIDTMIREMGELAASMVERATRAMVEADDGAVEQIIQDDKRMDQAQHDVDDAAVTLIAKRQPMAKDLRDVVCAIRTVGDLERIGDLAKNIAKRSRVMEEMPASRVLMQGLRDMSRLACVQVTGVVELYVADDAEGLTELRDRDEEIDIAYARVFRELLTYMMEDPHNITVCTHLLFCAKNLERIGDHATNIAENAYYMITGEQLPVKRPKRDELAGEPSAN
jgi:phosphate transport system protein